MRQDNQICQPRLVGYNVRLAPCDREEARRGLVGAWFRLGHSQTVLGGQSLEQVVYGAFLISIGSDVQHCQVRIPQSGNQDCRRECRLRGDYSLQGQKDFSDRHLFYSDSNAAWVEVAVPLADNMQSW